MRIQLDQIDLKILKLVQQNARLTAEYLGEQAGLSAPAAYRRLRRLRDEGVIENEVALLSAKALDCGMTFIVSVVMEKEHQKIMDDFIAAMQKNEYVQQCYLITGAADFIIIVKARDMDEFLKFCDVAFAVRDNFRKFDTMVVMEHVKVGLTLPIDRS